MIRLIVSIIFKLPAFASALAERQAAEVKAADERARAQQARLDQLQQDAARTSQLCEQLQRENGDLRAMREADQKEMLALRQRIADVVMAHEQANNKTRNLPASDVWDAALPAGANGNAAN
jgi:ABC-type phosphate transport system auxiliary subunit